MLCRLGADVNQRGAGQMSILTTAIVNGHYAAVLALLGNGPGLEWTKLDFALLHGHVSNMAPSELKQKVVAAAAKTVEMTDPNKQAQY